jgi:hypothetical protein
MADFEREVRVLFDEQDGQAEFAVDLDDLFENGLHEDRCDAEARFVEHQALRLAHERAADGEHLLFAAAERAGGLLLALLAAAERCRRLIEIFGEIALIIVAR